MLLYSIIILVCAALCWTLNFFFNPMNLEWWVYLLWIVGFILAEVIIDALVAVIVRKCMPAKWFDHNKKFFKTHDWEMKMYMKLKVNKWKDYVPELGGFTDFHKDKLTDPFNNQYIHQYIEEACYGIAIHIWSVPFSFLVIFLDFNMYTNGSIIFLTIGLPVAIINAILISLPAFILKFNLPRLVRIYDNNVWIENKKKEKEAN